MYIIKNKIILFNIYFWENRFETVTLARLPIEQNLYTYIIDKLINVLYKTKIHIWINNSIY